MITHQTVSPLIITILIVIACSEQAHSHSCQRSCPNGKSGKPVPYPFGFSDGCEIRLNCSRSETKIGEFTVDNITSTSIFIRLPAKCNRSIESIKHLFGTNYGLTRENSLLLQDCNTSRIHDCQIPLSFFNEMASSKGCTTYNKNDSLSCFSKNSDKFHIIDYEAVKNTSCKSLFASLSLDSGNSLEFQRLQLGWWLNGSCQKLCHKDANCTTVTRPGKELGYQCHCREGFEGDGFVNGASGCRKGESTRYYTY